MTASESSSLLATSQQILDQVGALVKQLQKQSVGAEEASPNVSSSELWSPKNHEVAELRANITVLSNSLLRTLNGPRQSLRNLVASHYDLAALKVMTEHNVFAAIPLDTGITLSELSVNTKIDEERLGRLIRLLSCDDILQEVDEGTVKHTAVSAALVQDHFLYDLVAMQLDDAMRGSAALPSYFADTIAGTSKAQSPFQYASGKTLFQYLAENPQSRVRFAHAMAAHSEFDNGQLLLSEWLKTHLNVRSVVIDVGGGSGHISIALAKEFPKLQFVVQERYEGMFAESSQRLPDDLKARIQFLRHDFFQPQPSSIDASEVKMFFLKQCLHNWSDEDCITILRNFVPIMKSSSEISLLINDNILSRDEKKAIHVQQEFRQMDIAMMVMLNTKQRTEQDWRALIQMIDPGLKVISIVTDPSPLGTMGLVELKFDASGTVLN